MSTEMEKLCCAGKLSFISVGEGLDPPSIYWDLRSCDNAVMFDFAKSVLLS